MAAHVTINVRKKYLICCNRGQSGVGAKYLSKNLRANRLGFITPNLNAPTDIALNWKGLGINRDLFRYQLQAEIQYRELPILFPTDCYQISLRILIRYETEKEPPHERRLY